MGNKSSKRRSWLAQIVCLTMLFSLLGGGYTGVASAKETRAAIAVSVEGVVMVTKAGGSNEYRAYTDMSLNQGDHIRTESGSNIVLQVVDQEDEVTIGPDSEVYLSNLMEAGGAKKSKLKMWAGSVWFKVKKLVNAEDEFEVETPTAVMGVRGSNGYIESKLGQLFAMMASGVLATSTNGDTGGEGESETSVYPGQQINYYEGQEGDPGAGLSGLDVSEFVKKADPAMIEKLLTTIQEIQEENAKFIDDVGKGAKQVDPKTGLTLGDASMLSQFGSNLNNLVANVAKSAIDENKVSKDKIQSLIDKANQSTTGEKIDLNNVKPFDKSIGLDPDVQKAKVAELQKIKEEQDKQREDAKKAIEDKLKANAELLQKLQEAKEKQEEANKLAQEALLKSTIDIFTATLSVLEKQKFDEDKQKADEEKKKQEEQQKSKETAPSPSPTTTPAPTPTPTPTPAPEATETPTPSPTATPTPSPTATPTPSPTATPTPSPTATPTPSPSATPVATPYFTMDNPTNFYFDTPKFLYANGDPDSLIQLYSITSGGMVAIGEQQAYKSAIHAFEFPIDSLQNGLNNVILTASKIGYSSSSSYNFIFSIDASVTQVISFTADGTTLVPSRTNIDLGANESIYVDVRVKDLNVYAAELHLNYSNLFYWTPGFGPMQAFDGNKIFNPASSLAMIRKYPEIPVPWEDNELMYLVTNYQNGENPPENNPVVGTKGLIRFKLTATDMESSSSQLDLHLILVDKAGNVLNATEDASILVNYYGGYE